MIFRLGDKKDLPEVCALLGRAKKALERQEVFQWDEAYPNEETLARDIGREELFVGVEQGGIRVFYVLNRECSPEYEGGSWKYPHVPCYIIHRLCVDPDFQGRGLGKQAMEHIEGQVISLGAGAVRLDAFTGNPSALALYRKLGYDIVGFAQWRMGRFCLMEKYLNAEQK